MSPKARPAVPALLLLAVLVPALSLAQSDIAAPEPELAAVDASVVPEAAAEPEEPYTGPVPRRGPDVEGIRSSPWADYDRNRIHDIVDGQMANATHDTRISVIVRFLEPVTEAQIDEVSAAHGGFQTRVRFTEPWGSIHGFSANLTAEQIRTLANRTDLLQIEENARLSFQ